MNRKLDLITDLVFGVVPAILFQPLVWLGTVGLLGNTLKAFRSFDDFIEYVFLFFLLSVAIFGTASLIYGFYVKLKDPARSYNRFVKYGTFLGTLVCAGFLLIGLQPTLSFAGVLLIPTVWVGTKYWYVSKKS
jgi:hypothetical protein